MHLVYKGPFVFSIYTEHLYFSCILLNWSACVMSEKCFALFCSFIHTSTETQFWILSFRLVFYVLFFIVVRFCKSVSLLSEPINHLVLWCVETTILLSARDNELHLSLLCFTCFKFNILQIKSLHVYKLYSIHIIAHSIHNIAHSIHFPWFFLFFIMIF